MIAGGLRRAIILTGVFAMTLVEVTPAGAAGGDQLWTRRYDGSSSREDSANAVAVSPDGTRVYVTGPSHGLGTLDNYVTLAYDAPTGETIWETRYNGPSNASDWSSSVAVSPDGSRVFVTGTSPGRGTGTDYATLAYDAATGETLWHKRYDGSAHAWDGATTVVVSPDGSQVFVTGWSEGTEPGRPYPRLDYATVAFDAVTGAARWVARYDGPGPSQDWAWAAAVNSEGSRVFVTGMSGRDYATVGYDAATGTQLWQSRYDGPANDTDSAKSIAVSPDGTRVFVTGWSDTTGAAYYDYATVAYDAASGDRLWARLDGQENPNARDEAVSLAVGPDGTRVFVTGTSRAGYVTVAFDAPTGGKLWLAHSGGGTATALGLSPDGTHVFVTGSVDAGDDDFATVAYDAGNGVALWERRYDGPASSDDSPRSLAVSPDGTRLFVTGQSYGSGTDTDFATVAYET
jgi:outer membrane protein assembly factor BamB